MTIYLPYRLTLNRPAVLRAPGGDANSATSLDYIPGSTMRGIVAGSVAPDDELLQRLVLTNELRYLNAHLEVDAGRSQRAPLSWRGRKVAGLPRNGHDLEVGAPPAGMTTTSMQAWWVADQVDASGLHVLAKPERIGRMHNQRDPRTGRSWQDEDGVTHGALYAYEAIAAGQTFRGMIALEDGALAAELRALLPDVAEAATALHDDAEPAVLHIGRSKLASYGGRASIEWLEPVDREVGGLFPATGQVGPGERLRIVLLSDMICRNGHSGTIDPAAVVNLLESQLPIVVERRWLRSAESGGFNKRWGMALPAHVAAAAGSTLACRTVSPIDQEQLQAIEHAGLGLRTRDGFGRVAFTTAPVEGALRFRGEVAMQLGRPTVSPPPILIDLQQRRLRRSLERNITGRAARIASSIERVPSPSLVGRLRRALREGGPDGLVAILSDDKLRVPARTQLTRSRVVIDRDPVTLLAGLAALASAGPDRITELAGVESARLTTQLADTLPDFDVETYQWARSRLVSEVLDRAHLQARKAGASGSEDAARRNGA